MQDIEGFLAVLKKGKIWMDSMLEMGNKEPGLAGTKKVAIETCKKKEFEHMANLYLKDVPVISELIKPGRNETKLKLKSKLSDIVVLGKDIVYNHKKDFDNSVLTFREQMRGIIKETEMLKEEINSLKALELEVKSIRNKRSNIEADSSAVGDSRNTLSSEPQMSFANPIKSVDTDLEEPNYHSVSEFIEDEAPKQSFWNRSTTSAELIKNLSKVLQEDSLNNLLVLKTPNVEPLVVQELFEVLTNRKWIKSSTRGLQLSKEEKRCFKKDAIKQCGNVDSEEAIWFLDYVNECETKEDNLQNYIEKNNLKGNEEKKNSNLVVVSDSESHHCVNVYTKSDFGSETNDSWFKQNVKDDLNKIYKEKSNINLVFDSSVGSATCFRNNDFANETNGQSVRHDVPNKIYETISNPDTVNTSVTDSVNYKPNIDFCSNLESLSDTAPATSSNEFNVLEQTVTGCNPNKVSADGVCVCDGGQSDKGSNQDLFCNPTTFTVQQVTEMLFTLSSALNRVPDDLKHARMVDLNPPQSMKEAISMLAHISKSIDIVQISKSFNDDEVQEERILGVVERKPGYCSLINSYRTSRNSEN